jgi:hypothetical protein
MRRKERLNLEGEFMPRSSFEFNSPESKRTAGVRHALPANGHFAWRSTEPVDMRLRRTK